MMGNLQLPRRGSSPLLMVLRLALPSLSLLLPLPSAHQQQSPYWHTPRLRKCLQGRALSAG